MILIILFTLLQQIVASKFVFTDYTHVAKTFSGAPCLTGCDSQFECVINWKWEKSNCRTFEVAPIYRTSRIKDSPRKYCLSNCGYFGYTFEWCITTEDLKWDYCSSLDTSTFTSSLEPVTKTRLGETCSDRCRWNEDRKYYWCNFKKDGNVQWEYCAPPALPRVPVLRENFYIGEKKKGNCNGFLKYVSAFPNNFTAADAADYFVTDLADALEETAKINPLSQVIKVANDTPIQSYTVVKIRNMTVPVVIRAHITNESIRVDDQSKISAEVERKLREQMAGSTSSFEGARLIGSQLGGPNSEYNLVPRSVDWKCDEWWDMELAVKNWCHTSGGAVDMTVVIFYKDANTPIPHAFGVSLVYKNDDNSMFVDCREKIHFNYF